MNTPQSPLPPQRFGDRSGGRVPTPEHQLAPEAAGTSTPVAAPSPVPSGGGAPPTRPVEAMSLAPGAHAATLLEGPLAGGLRVAAPQTPGPTGGCGPGSPSAVVSGVGRLSTAQGEAGGVAGEGAPPASPRTAARQARVAEYRHLTRDKGLTRKAARRRLGLSHQTALNYEREITGLTGTQRREQLRAQHTELLGQGLNHVQIGRRLGIHRKTSMAWARLHETEVS